MEKKAPGPPPPPARALRRADSIPAMPAPPVPLRAKTPPPPIPSTRTMILAASTALRLRDEQVQARVRYYKADLKTNAELDAITERVVAELHAFSGKATVDRSGDSIVEIEIELIRNLRELLEKLFARRGSGFFARKLEEVQRRITQLFFSSELYASLAADDRGSLPSASWPEQALYFAVKHHEDEVIASLQSIPVSDPEITELALERFQTWQKQLCGEFLSKTTPELQRLLEIYRNQLTVFFHDVFRAELGEFCWEVVRESRIATAYRSGHKVSVAAFPAFREVFDRKFLEHLVLGTQPELMRQVEGTDQFRDATLRFVADPRIYTEICATINDAVYDYLHSEGYLELPPDWRRLLNRPTG